MDQVTVRSFEDDKIIIPRVRSMARKIGLERNPRGGQNKNEDDSAGTYFIGYSG